MGTGVFLEGDESLQNDIVVIITQLSNLLKTMSV